MPVNVAPSSTNAFAAVIVAAGNGSRMGGGQAKQFRLIGGVPVVRWSINALLGHKDIKELVVVGPAGNLSELQALSPIDDRLKVVAGGPTRTMSVRNGLQALSKNAAKVLIHDAARPGLSIEVIDELLLAIAHADAAAPALPLDDAVKEIGAAGGLRTVDRGRLVRVQTPQAFKIKSLTAALAGAGDDLVDDLAAIEASGGKVILTRGRNELMKLTREEDMPMVARMLAPQEMRVGSGFDVHAFETGDHVTLCGVVIPHSHGLKGHSDADVAWHALTDAILGALALGDIGDHFPPSDPQWKGAASVHFLKHAVEAARNRGFAIANCDLTILCELPKIKPHREALRTSTSAALGLDIDRVSVKATTTERLGFLGRAEGIAAEAVVLLKG